MFGPLEGLTDLSLPAGSDQILDLTYALDMARGVSAALLTPETKHKIFNISGGKAYTISEVHRVIARYAPIPDNLRIGPGRLMPRGAPLDIRRAREELGYVPEYDLDRGVEALHRYLLRGELRESRP
jgi:nucleoside-diphosphate-sugar epimerase